MTDPNFLSDPFDIVAPLLLEAVDARRSPTQRAAACRALAELSPEFLRRLCVDGDWRYVERLLEGGVPEEGGDALAGDGAWSAKSDPFFTSGPAPLPTPAPGALPLVATVELYLKDLRRLVQDDFLATPAVAGAPTLDEADASELAALAAQSHPEVPGSPEAFARGLAWSLVGHGSGAATIAARFPGNAAALAAFMDECSRRHVERGLPPALAARVMTAIDGSAARRAWFDEVMLQVEARLAREPIELLDREAFIELHLALRVLVARHVRDTEMLDGQLIAVTELATVVRLLRAAAGCDVAAAAGECDHDATAFVAAHDLQGSEGRAHYEVGLYGVLRQPTATLLERNCSGADRQALRLVRERVRRVVGERGVLSDEPADARGAQESE